HSYSSWLLAMSWLVLAQRRSLRIILPKNGAFRVPRAFKIIWQDHGANTAHGQEFQQHRMRETAVNDMGRCYPAFDRVERRFHLWNHARIQIRKHFLQR